MKVELKFLNSLSDLAKKFRFASDTIDKCDSIKTPCYSYQGVELSKTEDNLGEQDKRIIYDNIVNTENPHKQLRKTISIDYEIYGITRALLQEFARHPMGNPFVVKSTRYVLHRIAKDERIPDYIEEQSKCYFNDIPIEIIEDLVKDYYYIPENDFIPSNSKRKISEEKLEWLSARYYELQKIKFYKNIHNMKNDQLKKYINEYMLCNITGNMSGECLWNLLKQRLNNVAWYQFQDLAKEIYSQIPEEWKPLFKVYKYKKLELGDDLKEVYYKLMRLYTEGKLVEKEYLV